MRKTFVMVALALSCAAVHADELADGISLFDKGQFAQALQIYQKLAETGNPEAQNRLGEMYWYGEAGSTDYAKAEQWLKKAADQGHAQAKANLGLIAARHAKLADIEYYTTRFDGGDTRLEKVGCVRPEIPDKSLGKREIVVVDRNVKAWTECYNRFVANLNDALPPGKTIPKSLQDVMSNDDIAKAREKMDKVYSSLAQDAEKLAQTIANEHQQWIKATEELVRLDANRNVQALGSLHTNNYLDAVRLNKTLSSSPNQPVVNP